MKRRDQVLFVLLLGLGCTQMVGDLLGWSTLKGLGAALQVAPAMKVFTAHHGYETYANRFFLSGRDGHGQEQRIELTPQRYRAVAGPYNRRNVYGAALAYGPLLRQSEAGAALQASVMRYALCEPAPLRAELGLSPDIRHWRIEVMPLRADARQGLSLNWELSCDAH